MVGLRQGLAAQVDALLDVLRLEHLVDQHLHLALEDPTRLRRLAVRMASPCLPGESITTSAWRLPGSDSAPDTERYAFRTARDAEPGRFALTDGLVEFATTGEK